MLFTDRRHDYTECSNKCVNRYVFQMYIQQNSPYPDAGYPDRLGPAGKHFYCNCTTDFCCLNFSPICQIHISNCVLMIHLYVNKYVA